MKRRILIICVALLSLSTYGFANNTAMFFNSNNETVIVVDPASDGDDYTLNQTQYRVGDIVSVVNKGTANRSDVVDDSSTVIRAVYPGTTGRLVCISNVCATSTDWKGMNTIVSDWKSYTPTFTGFGTVTVEDFRWKRNGSNIEIRGRFTSDTPTTTEGRVSFPFTSNSNLDTVEFAGEYGRDVATTESGRALIEPSVGYLTFSRGIASIAALTKSNGDDLITIGDIAAIHAILPISGWNQQ